jgi:hypothetical protein
MQSRAKKLALSVFLAAPLAAPALANTRAADCSGWTVSTVAPEGAGSFYAKVDTVLERQIAPGVWVVHDGATVEGFWSATNTDWSHGVFAWLDLGQLWQNPMVTGDYRATMTLRSWGAGHPYPLEQRVIGADNFVWLTIQDARAAVAGSAYGFTESFALPPVTFHCDVVGPPPTDPHTQGYWKNHGEAWGASSLPIGDLQTPFSKSCLLQFYGVPTKGDSRVSLVHQLVAAKLNLIAGSDPQTVTGYPLVGSTVTDTIAAADAALRSVDVSCGGLAGPKPSGAYRDHVNALKDALDAYNNNSL